MSKIPSNPPFVLGAYRTPSTASKIATTLLGRSLTAVRKTPTRFISADKAAAESNPLEGLKITIRAL